MLCLAASQARGRDHDPRRRRAAPQGIGPDRRDRRGPDRPRRTGQRRRRRPRHRRPDSRSSAPTTDSLDDHRLAMTFAVAGLIASGRDHDRCARRSAADLLPGLLPRTRRGPGMTKRVVLIGHPVAHSLSGAMQQAAFDERGHRRRVRAAGTAPPMELADADRRAARRRLPRRQRDHPAQGAGRPAGRPADRGGPATGAVNTITREGKRLVGHNTDVPGIQGRARRARRQAEDAAPGGRARRRRRRAGGRLRPDHARASRGSSCSIATSIGPRAWSSTSAGAPPTWSSRRCPGTSRSSRPSWPRPRSWSTPRRSAWHGDVTPIPGELLPPDLLVLDLIYRRTRLLARRRSGRRRRSPNGELMLLHQGAAAFTLWTGQPAPLELMQAQARRRGPGGIESAEGEPTGAAGRAGLTRGPAPLPDRRRVARPGARGDRRGACRPGSP